MNLESRIPHITYHEPTVSAGGHNYWQPAEPEVTITERAAQVGEATQKIATHRVTVVAGLCISLVVILFATYVQVSQYREKAYHAKLQRESRIVTL